MLIHRFVLDSSSQNSIRIYSFNRLVKLTRITRSDVVCFYLKASQSIGSEDLVNMKRRMYLISSEAKTDLKYNAFRNHTKFIETAKQVAALESEVYQLQSLLADEKQLLSAVKESLTIETKVR